MVQQCLSVQSPNGLVFSLLAKITILASMLLLLLAKITILASMLVGRVCLLLLAKITFWQVCYSVCLSVCLFVALLHHISRTNHQIITKLGPHMELGTAKRPIVFGVDDVTDDVIRSKSRSNFEIAISQAIFKLQRRNKN